MTNPVCAVIGAGPGIGLSVAKRFAREGFALGLLARNQEKLRAFERELNASGAKTMTASVDASDPASLRLALERVQSTLGPIGVLVYNPVVPRAQKPSGLSFEDAVQDFKVNVAGALVAAQTVLPGMKERASGSILFTGGGMALRPNPLFSSVALGKAALRNLTYSLAQEVKSSGVHVATVTVSAMVKPDSPLPDAIAEKFWELHAQSPDAWQTEIEFTP